MAISLNTRRRRRVEAVTAGKNTLGLQPPNIGDLQAQINRAWAAVHTCHTDLDKYQVRPLPYLPAVSQSFQMRAV